MTGTIPFGRLPGPLSRLLLAGGRGPGLAAARDEAGWSGPAALADALALAVWEDAPLAPEAAAVAAARHAGRPFLPPETNRVVAAVAASARPAGPEPYFDRLAARREIPKMLAYLLDRHRKDPADAGILHRLSCLAPMADAAGEGALAEVAALLADLAGPLAPAGALVAGELSLLAGRTDAAEAHLRRSLAGLPTAAAGLRLAEALLRQGGREAALAELAAACAGRPCDVLATTRLYDLATGLADRLEPLPGPVAVLLYSFNSAPLLARTLEALEATDWAFAPAGARIVVLDNGSADDTAAVCAAARDRSAGRLEVVSLPVNVGAPAARNWLAALPPVRAAAFAAYLDDDALVPPDWLGRFGAAVAAMPGAGVWGSLVRATDAPRFVQSADTHLLPTPRGQDGESRAFALARPWLTTADWGQYALCRPCASVTGCCHLFRTDVLTGLGGFDIRFSPTQYDDLDLDIRQLLAGRPAACQGHLTVLHAKATGAAAHVGGKQYGSAFANQFKLHHKYDDGQIEAAARTAFDALAADLAGKIETLAGLGLIGPETPEAGEGERGV
ncbi:glycosyl transferase family 2 [Solidesulfovibrio carbinoliphilus subsp. oakridgensis]|uniref:Glycosyl transferase family 2 n=1 Tax=Solidesulfovibrio carbinoliphilus subsp. oakridgensis TaxID=694327 RepID=G7QCS9_9BACT|nr:glycosyltransferase [Solidesulfovibrio carbinoliphilus]EHJ46235.1 glycosyl transferase family 2 [Solidesulfovibrio carbinoliphilus subsp. oakridgensis]